MTTAHDVVDQAHERSGRVSPADVQNVLFSRAGIGRRGYDEGEVDFFLDQVQTELSRLLGEKVALRDEVAALREQLSSGARDEAAPRRDEASAQAVKVLSAAQQTADQYVADAESYTKRLAEEGRERYERTVEEAVARARTIVEEARAEAEATLAAATAAAESVADGAQAGLVAGGAASDATTAELEQQAAYLRTFGQVCRVQLRAYLEALLRDVELEWGRAHPGAVGAPADTPAPAAARPVDLDRASLSLNGDSPGREPQPAATAHPVQA